MTGRLTRWGGACRRLPRPITPVARRVIPLGMMLVSLGCSDIGGISDGLDVQSAVLAVTPPGSTARSYTVTAAGGSTPNPVRLRVGVNQLNATWLDGGRGEAGAGQLTLVVGDLTDGVTFRSLGGGRGTLTAPSTGTDAIGELRAERIDGSASFAADLDFVVDR